MRCDEKPLGIGMCYCCGSILWSRVDNSHTHLVNLDVRMKQWFTNVPWCLLVVEDLLTIATRVANCMYVRM